MSAAVCSTTVRWPELRFYWAVANRSLCRGRGGRAARYLAEPLFPVALEHLHVVAAVLDQRRVVVCAVEVSKLKGLCDDVVSLVPERLPPAIEGAPASFDVHRLNLLTGEHLPRRLQSSRSKLGLLTALGVLSIMTLVSYGLTRRSALAADGVHRYQQASSAIQNDVLGSAPDGSNQPPELQMVLELRRLKQTRAVAPTLDDAKMVLQSLLAAWPNHLHAAVELVTITSSSVTVRAELSPTQVAAFEDSLTGWPGWRREQPEVLTRGGVATVTVRLARAPTAPPNRGAP